jgi:glutamine cyclotransferase
MRIKPIPLLLIEIVLMAFSGCKSDLTNYVPIKESIPVIDYYYVKSYPHDTTSFTEGFLITRDTLFESTGSPEEYPRTRSVFGPVDLSTGRINIKVELNREKYFGEGIAYLNGKFYQLTYTTKIGFVYDATTYKKINEFSFLSNQGWGLTTDGKDLIMSDGTNKLTYLDPGTFLVTKIIPVTVNESAKRNLNELEFINGFIYANLWPTDTIVKIDTASGKVVGLLDLTSLAKEAKSICPEALEMNGIAYDPSSDEILITGKLWPKIYRIKLID